MILIIKHISIEGPGTIADFFNNSSWETKTIELGNGDRLPENLSKIEAVIALGGPMNVYEEDRFPFLKEEDTFIKKVLEEGTPFLGICLGAQLLAKACGAKVDKAAEEELGWYKVRLTREGLKDPLFLGVDSEIDVFQWHGDTFEIPDGGTLLATSHVCNNQAFRFGKSAYGLQFHIEVTNNMIKDWIKEYVESSDKQLELMAEQMLVDYMRIKDSFNKEANTIYLNFGGIIADER